MRWLESPFDAESIRSLARELKVSPLVCALARATGNYTEPAAAQAFLHPSLEQLHSPDLMAGMREAVNACVVAVARRGTTPEDPDLR